MSNMIRQTGIIKYEPYRGRMKTSQYWCILKLPDDLVKYYRYFIKKELHVELCDPSWGAHVSIIRGEEPKNKDAWKKYEGKSIIFEYEPIIITKKDNKQLGSFYFIDFYSEDISQIRQELGLPVYKTSHFTIGRTYYD